MLGDARPRGLYPIELTEIRGSAAWPRRVEYLILLADDWLYRTPHGQKKKVELSIRIATPHLSCSCAVQAVLGLHLISWHQTLGQRPQHHPLRSQLELLPSTRRYETSICGPRVS